MELILLLTQMYAVYSTYIHECVAALDHGSGIVFRNLLPKLHVANLQILRTETAEFYNGLD